MSRSATAGAVLSRSLRRTGRLVYRRSLRFVLVSVCWVLCSLPLVTIGPATLGAYAAIDSIRIEDRIDTDRIYRTLRRHGMNAALVSVVPLSISLFTAAYFYQYVLTGAFRFAAFTIAGVYLLVFLLSVLLTACIEMSREAAFTGAIAGSYRRVIHNPVIVGCSVLVALSVLLVGAVSIVGLVLFVPAVLFVFHTEVIEQVRSDCAETIETNTVNGSSIRRRTG